MRLVHALFILGLILGATMMPAESTAAQQTGKAPPESPSDSCLVLSAENIVSGAGNWFLYVRFSPA